MGALGQLLALLHLEGVAAAARGDGVRVVDLEARLLNRVQEVDRGALQVRRAERVDHDRDALERQLDVTLGGAGVEAEAVLEAGAPATLDRDAEDECCRVLLLGHELPDLRRRDGRERDQGVGGMLDSCHGLIVADGVAGSRRDFVTVVSLIPCGFPDPFVRPKGEC